MRALLFVVLVSSAASAQERCGSAQCFGLDGGPVVVGARLKVSNGSPSYMDGGANVLEPASSGATLMILGTKSAANTDPDIILGSKNTRTGSAPIFQIRNGGPTGPVVFQVGPGGVDGGSSGGGLGGCTFNGGIGTCPVLDAGFATAGVVVAGTRVTSPIVDAGVGHFGKASASGTWLAVANPNDAGAPEPRCIYGREVLAANASIVSFNPAFGIAPACSCSHEDAAPIGCGPTAAATTSGVTFGVPAGTGTVSWICCGGR
jgi:hypothetical protein